MKPSKQFWNDRRLTISAVDPSEQVRRMHEAVARRAHEIYESRGCVPGQELEDWRRAESEVVKPLSCGFLTLDEKVWVGTDALMFQEGEIDICVEPRRLVICGKEPAARGELTSKAGEPASRAELAFHVLDLPVEIDPLQARARFNGRWLDIDLAYANGSRAGRSLAKAA